MRIPLPRQCRRVYGIPLFVRSLALEIGKALAGSDFINIAMETSGLDLVNVMRQLCNWGKKNIPYKVRIKPTAGR